MEDFLDLDLTLSCTAIVLSVFHDYFDLVIVSVYEISVVHRKVMASRDYLLTCFTS